MPQRYVIPPQTEKERFAIGLTMPQLIWAGAGLALGFGGFMFWSWLTDSLFMSVVFGVPVGFVVLPFIVYRPKERSMTYLEYLRYKWKIKHRNSKLPHMRSNRRYDDKNNQSNKTTDEAVRKEVALVDINLGGGSST